MSESKFVEIACHKNNFTAYENTSFFKIFDQNIFLKLVLEAKTLQILTDTFEQTLHYHVLFYQLKSTQKLL